MIVRTLFMGAAFWMLSFQAATSQSGAFPDSFGIPVEKIDDVPADWEVYRIKPVGEGAEYCAALTRDNGLLVIFRADDVEYLLVDLVATTRSSLMTELRSSESPSVTVMVDESHEWTIDGATTPDSVLLELTPDWVSAIQGGNELSFRSEDGKRLFVSLRGSRPALDALVDCQNASGSPKRIATEGTEPVPAQADDWDSCSRVLDSEERIRGCSAIIEAATEPESKIADAYANRGVAYYVKRDYDRAIEDFGRAVALDPDTPSAYIFRAKSYRVRGDYDRAIEDYGKAIEFFPGDPEIYDERGSAYLSKGDYGQAILDYDRAIALDPTDARFLNSRCWARAVAGTDLDRARTDCDAALRISNEPSILDSRGLVSLKQELFSKAWNDYDAALQAGPSASFLYGRGYAAFRLGRKEDGEADITAAVELDAGIACPSPDFLRQRAASFKGGSGSSDG